MIDCLSKDGALSFVLSLDSDSTNARSSGTFYCKPTPTLESHDEVLLINKAKMAGSALVPKQHYHVRSISMPCRPQPYSLKVEEDLHKLKTCVAPSSSATLQMVSNGLRGLGDLYNSIEELLCLPSNKQALSKPLQKKWVERVLDQSIVVLDLCVVVKDNLAAMKEHAQELSLALRRKDASLESKLQAYIRMQKKAEKEINNCFKSLKQMDNKWRSASTHDKDCDQLMVVRMLREAREITISLVRAVLPSFCNPRANPKNGWWSIVPGASYRMKVASKDVLEYTSEMCFEGLETGLECLFRCLIQNRVSLLNIISL